jgi:hypothetical protein
LGDVLATCVSGGKPIDLPVLQHGNASAQAGFAALLGASLPDALFPVCCFPVAFAQHDRKWFR